MLVLYVVSLPVHSALL